MNAFTFSEWFMSARARKLRNAHPLSFIERAESIACELSQPIGPENFLETFQYWDKMEDENESASFVNGIFRIDFSPHQVNFSKYSGTGWFFQDFQVISGTQSIEQFVLHCPSEFREILEFADNSFHPSFRK